MYRSSKGIVYGVGINDSSTPVRETTTVNGKTVEVWGCPFYKAWVQMLYRCYSESYRKKYTYRYNATVCEEWLRFSNFRDWMSRKDYVGKQLDKDILVPGNREYGPDKCVFVSQELNKFFNMHKNRKRKTLPGAYPHQRGRRYTSQITIHGENRRLGQFATESDAHFRWVEEKIVALKEYITYDGSALSARLEEIVEMLETKLNGRVPVLTLLEGESNA